MWIVKALYFSQHFCHFFFFSLRSMVGCMISALHLCIRCDSVVCKPSLTELVNRNSGRKDRSKRNLSNLSRDWKAYLMLAGEKPFAKFLSFLKPESRPALSCDSVTCWNQKSVLFLLNHRELALIFPYTTKSTNDCHLPHRGRWGYLSGLGMWALASEMNRFNRASKI